MADRHSVRYRTGHARAGARATTRQPVSRHVSRKTSGQGSGRSEVGGVDSATARRPGPVRTCVGCRKRGSKAEFVRVVVVRNQLVPDLRGRLPGRGAHIHPDPGCLDLAERRQAFSRALRRPGPWQTAAVRQAVEDGSGHHAVKRHTVRAASDANVESRSSDAMSAR
ncbi:MAG: YlxR family protein [Frankiaceae bacterium]